MGFFLLHLRLLGDAESLLRGWGGVVGGGGGWGGHKWPSMDPPPPRAVARVDRPSTPPTEATPTVH